MTANIDAKDRSADVIVFTDLDGTLLDHKTYDHRPAHPTLSRLRASGIPLVLASSKTADEMIPLRAELGFSHCPLICENGSGVVPGGANQTPDRSAYVKLRAALDAMPAELRACYEGFGDMDLARISAVTGLTRTQAELAAKRAFSEPGLWTGSAAARAVFLAFLSDKGVSARLGGRFLTLSFGGTKADRMTQIKAGLRRSVVIALGDAPNDAEMLGAADYALVLPNAHGHPVKVPAHSTARVTHATAPGPTGWNTALGQVLTDLGIQA